MAKSVAKKASNILVWALLGLLMIGLAGFGIGSFSGSTSEIGSVGSAKITANEYARALQNELQAQQAENGDVTNLAAMRARGLDRAVLEGLVARAALSHEAGAMGLSVGDDLVARQIREIPSFQGIDGQFDRQGYEFALTRAGLDATEYEETVRSDVARSLLQAAVVGGITGPELFSETIVAYQGETRNFTVARVTEADLTEGLTDPTEEELLAHYEEFGDRFTSRELRRITYTWVTPEMIMDDMDISEDALRSLYDDRADQFIQPERRLLERLVFPSQDEAQAARDALDAGETDFDTLIDDRGLTLDDVDLGEVAASDLAASAAEAIFADQDSEIMGPLDSRFGPALFRINAVLEASIVSFEDAAPDLRAELAEEAARRAIGDELEILDDLLASGATLEDLAAETDMELGQIEFDETQDAGIAGYDSFREAAAAAADGDFPEVLELSDGGLFALRLDEIVPPALPPFEEVREAVTASWRAVALRSRLRERADALVVQIAMQGTALEDLGLETDVETAIRRQDFIPDGPPTLVAQVFQLAAPGDTVVIPSGGAAFIARLDAINSAARDAPDTSILLELVRRQVAASFAQDIFEAYGQALEADIGITMNPAVINAVHAQFP